MFLIQNMRIADAYEMAARNDPSDVSFDQGKMYKHLVQRSEKGRFWTFSAIVEHRFSKRQTYGTNLFFYCSMPKCWDDMVKCEFVISDPSTVNNR